MTQFISTRGYGPKSFEDVLLEGLAPDGGLYVPAEWPSFTEADLRGMAKMTYAEVAAKVMQPFIGGDIAPEKFKEILDAVYVNGNFDHIAVAPLNQLSGNIWNMELHRGPTIAFKDVALQLLGALFDHVLKEKNQHVTIVGATSGDTGSAAIEGCKACDNVDIFILHPKGRVSDVQRKQMTTVKADNVHNIALEGTFDDCQNLVKAMFNDPDFRSQMRLSAINSINWARIMAQIVYYFTSALALGAPDRKIAFSVPTGNFGNVYAAHAARKMGLPIADLVIATNRNDILTRFFETGEMKMTGVEASLSPSMDIQISSNFERYLFELFGRDHAKLAAVMNDFKETGTFKIDGDLLSEARSHFKAHRCSDEDTLAVIKNTYEKTAEILDPHSAIALSGAQAFEREIDAPIVSLACAHAAKFPDAVEKAIGQRPPLPARMADLFEKEEHLTALPNDLQAVQQFVRDNIRAKTQNAA